MATLHLPLDAGRLRHRIRIEQFVLALDSNGDVLQDPNTGATSGQWTEVATVWGSIEPLSAKEFIQSQATQAQIVARILIRYRAGLDASMRLVHMVNGVRGTVFNIAGILSDRDSGLEYITLPVSAGVSDSGQ